METIDEKSNSEKLTSDDNSHANLQRDIIKPPRRRSSRSPNSTTVASRARSNSNSSMDECPRARSRSLSSEREYENTKSSSRTSSRQSRTHSSNHNARSSSIDSQSQYSSADEEISKRNNKNVKRDAHLKQNSISSYSHKKVSQSKVENPPEVPKRSKQRSSTTSSCTVHSSQRERMECNKDAKIKHGSSSPTVVVVRNSSSSGSRRHRDGNKTDGQRFSDERQLKKDKTSNSNGIRLLRHAQEDAIRSSHHTERHDRNHKDSKERISKSKGMHTF